LQGERVGTKSLLREEGKKREAKVENIREEKQAVRGLREKKMGESLPPVATSSGKGAKC